MTVSAISTPPAADAPAESCGAQTARSVIRTALQNQSRDLSILLDRLDLDHSPSAVHAARVVVRRLDTTLGLGTSIYRAGSVRHAREELDWLMGLLACVRDADVTMHQLHDLDAASSLIDATQNSRDVSYSTLTVARASARCAALQSELRTLATVPPTVPQADDAARKRLRPILRRRWKKLEHAIDALANPPDRSELHKARIRVKRLRYASEFCAVVFGRDAARTTRRLHRLQDALGAVHDTDMLIERVRAIAADDPAAAFAAGEIAERARSRDTHADRDWREQWKRVQEKRNWRWL